MLLVPPKFIICEYQNGIVPIAEFENYNSANWGKAFSEFYKFQIQAPLNNNTKDILKTGRIIWDIQYGIGGIIEIVNYVKTEKGAINIIAKGRTLECLLSYRAVANTEIIKNKNVTTAMYNMVDKNIINPLVAERKILGFENSQDEQLGPIITMQVTGKNLYNFCNDLANSYNCGFDVSIDLPNAIFKFTSKMFVDKTINQNILPPIVFSNETEDILTDEYYINKQGNCTMAYVAGESVGNQRTVVEVNKQPGLVGFYRHELFVDARDLQTEVGITEQEYEQILTQRGLEKLSENDVVENFSTKLNLTRLRFGEDFNVGDKVTIFDSDLGVTTDSLVTKAEFIISANKGIDLSITFGNSLPSLYKRMK